MTKTEQVEVVREKINFEKEFLDYQIKLVKEAEKELENCSYYELDLISKDEYKNVREQAFNKTFR